MRMRLRPEVWSVIVSIVICTCAPHESRAVADPLAGLAKRIMSTSRLDSTAVLVVFDSDLLEELRSRLPQSIAVVPFWPPDVLRQGAIEPTQMGRMFREASAATMNHTDVWVVGVGKPQDPRTTRRADAFADMAARMARRRILRDSIRTSRGTVTFSEWVDLPGGVAQRAETRRALAYADSVMAHGGPRLTPITSPFTRSELAVDPEALSYYVAQLADTSFYSIGGCSDVEIVMWNASEKLGQMGPGVVPVLVRRIADPNPFVRERVQDALLFATQDERILARTGGDYLKFYDQPATSSRDIVDAWWSKFGHFWTQADSTR